jgi:SAM-dependent methyltransferase/Zn ribbon nucleic-acid-binding protein
VEKAATGTAIAFAGVPRRQGKPLDMRTLHRSIEWRRQIARDHEATARRCRPERNVTACPACAGDHHVTFVQIYGFDYHECTNCGHLYLHNPPAPETIAQLYQGDTVQAQVYVGEELFRRRVEQIARPKAAFCREHIQPEGEWFDVGCGTGELLSVVREAGWIARGCEADPAHVRFARSRGLDVLEGYVDELPPELTASVRVLSALNLLEHVPAPKPWLARLTAGLVVGGHVVIEVPRHPSLSSFSNLLHPELASRHIYPPDHLHIFTEASLEHVLGACGLRARAVWVFGQDFQELLYSSAARAGLPESGFFHRLLDAAGSIQLAIDRENLSDVLFVVAQKV